jgi:hypothetical protein
MRGEGMGGNRHGVRRAVAIAWRQVSRIEQCLKTDFCRTTGEVDGQAFPIRNCDALFSNVSRGISFEETTF